MVEKFETFVNEKETGSLASYNKTVANIKKELDFINNFVKKNITSKSDVDWGNVGDINHLLEQLSEISSSLKTWKS